jgi:hypothetical protein
MNRSALQVAVIALLAAAAIVAVAGSVDDPQTGGAGVDGPGDPQVTETRTTQEPTTADSGTAETRRAPEGGNDPCEETFLGPLAWLGIVAVLALVVAYVYREYGQMEAFALTMLLLVLLFFAFSVFGLCNPPEQTYEDAPNGSMSDDPNRTQEAVDAPGGAAGSDGTTTPDFPLAVVAIVAVLAAAAVGAVLVTRDDEADEDPFGALDADDDGVEEPMDDVAVDEVAAAAGRAADRIEDADDVDNEIYRAWVEMTNYLDVEHPESSTPGEFAAAAIDAGIEPDTVAELTDLFERVRYGSTAATTEREQRALDALRRIETQYGDGGDDA